MSEKAGAGSVAKPHSNFESCAVEESQGAYPTGEDPSAWMAEHCSRKLEAGTNLRLLEACRDPGLLTGRACAGKGDYGAIGLCKSKGRVRTEGGGHRGSQGSQGAHSS